MLSKVPPFFYLNSPRLSSTAEMLRLGHQSLRLWCSCRKNVQSYADDVLLSTQIPDQKCEDCSSNQRPEDFCMFYVANRHFPPGSDVCMMQQEGSGLSVVQTHVCSSSWVKMEVNSANRSPLSVWIREGRENRNSFSLTAAGLSRGDSTPRSYFCQQWLLVSNLGIFWEYSRRSGFYPHLDTRRQSSQREETRPNLNS